MNFPQQSQPPHQPADPLEQQDWWRTTWNFITHDGVLLTFLLIAVVTSLIGYTLPQTPNAGTSDAYGYGIWQTQAQAQTGVLYEFLSSVGAFSLFQQAWFRLVLAALGALATLRLLDAAARLRLAKLPAHVLRDEMRLRVTRSAPPIANLASALRAKKYNVIETPDQLHANRTPYAEAISIVFYVGILLTLLGALLNAGLGWHADNRTLINNSPALLAQNNTATLIEDNGVMMALLEPSAARVPLILNTAQNANGVQLTLKQTTPGFRVSATDARTSQPLSLTLSSFGAATTDAQLTFLPDENERTLALPAKNMVLQVSLPTSNTADATLTLFTFPNGAVLSQTQVAASVVISNVAFEFKPSSGAIVDARYAPGNPLWWMGVLLALLGGAGVAAYPVQRAVVKHHGEWTEFYGSGRGVRAMVRGLSSEPSEPNEKS